VATKSLHNVLLSLSSFSNVPLSVFFQRSSCHGGLYSQKRLVHPVRGSDCGFILLLPSSHPKQNVATWVRDPLESTRKTLLCSFQCTPAFRKRRHSGLCRSGYPLREIGGGFLLWFSVVVFRWPRFSVDFRWARGNEHKKCENKRRKIMTN
jgi:hypothetical protein